MPFDESRFLILPLSSYLMTHTIHDGRGCVMSETEKIHQWNHTEGFNARVRLMRTHIWPWSYRRRWCKSEAGVAFPPFPGPLQSHWLGYRRMALSRMSSAPIPSHLQEANHVLRHCLALTKSTRLTGGQPVGNYHVTGDCATAKACGKMTCFCSRRMSHVWVTRKLLSWLCMAPKCLSHTDESVSQLVCPDHFKSERHLNTLCESSMCKVVGVCMSHMFQAQFSKPQSSHSLIRRGGLDHNTFL